ncbi:MAG: hypothetical protein Q7J06_06905 [Bacteroidales bacterium]|nr:hypothetical protein [Bacteroidales bacterium]
MKRSLAILTVILLTMFTVSAQDKVALNKPIVSLSGTKGYITINELTAGIGLGDVSVPYSKSFFGFTTIHGYQINESFVVGGGTGVSFYNGGTFIPVFADVRYRFLIKINTFTPYLFGDGGFLINTTGGMKMFINGGAGVRYTINNQIGINFGTGLWIQYGDTRDSFVNFKLGVTFKPK